MASKKLGVLLVNLGTPEAPTAEAVRDFLKAFLSDKRVVDLPRLIWLPVLYGIILNFRPKKVAVNYQKIWTEDGSPLMAITKAQRNKLQAALDSSEGIEDAEYKVEIGMTYLKPSIEEGLNNLQTWGAEKVVVLPLYPQYSTTTSACVSDQIEAIKQQYQFELQFIEDYHDDPAYISALADSVKQNFDADADKLVLSFHGIPKRYVESKGDPYQAQCEVTASKLAKALELESNQWELAYQSRVGKEEWLKPYLDERMESLADEGTKSIKVICPGFSADCLETLEEIAMENKETFIESGGESFEYIKALNDEDSHINMMKSLVLRAF